MPARHLVADGNLALLSDIYANQFVDSMSELVVLFAGKGLNVYNDAGLTVRYTYRCVSDFTDFFTENSAIKSFFRCQLGFTLGCNLTDNDVACMNFCTDTDHTVFVKILQGIVTDVGNFTGDLFRTKLGITGFALIFSYVNLLINIITHQALTDKDGVLKVVAFPWHEADQCVATQSLLTLIS